jgi:predicted Zn finger-like uncharacterized protein
MIVECPSCNTKYNFPDDKIGPEPRKVRCARCENIFVIEPPEPPPAEDDVLDLEDMPKRGAASMEPEVQEQPAKAGPEFPEPPEPPESPESPAEPSFDEAFDSEFGSDFETGGEEDEDEGVDFAGPAGFDESFGQASDTYDAEEERPEDFSVDESEFDVQAPFDASEEDREEAEPEEPRDEESEDFSQTFASVGGGKAGKGPMDMELEEKPLKEKGSRQKVVLIILILAILGGGAYFAYTYKDMIMGLIGGEEEIVEEEETAEPVSTPQDQVKNISLANVRQYYVQNEKVGQVFVIEGKAVNNFAVPKELIKVEAILFDDTGAELVSKEVMAGNTVTLFQLQVLSRAELEAALASEVGILSANTNIQPGGAVPFMIVMFNPPENVAEYAVKVTEAKEPPQ